MWFIRKVRIFRGLIRSVILTISLYFFLLFPIGLQSAVCLTGDVELRIRFLAYFDLYQAG